MCEYAENGGRRLVDNPAGKPLPQPRPSPSQSRPAVQHLPSLSLEPAAPQPLLTDATSTAVDIRAETQLEGVAGFAGTLSQTRYCIVQADLPC